jgi:Na+/glutamate symporter
MLNRRKMKALLALILGLVVLFVLPQVVMFLVLILVVAPLLNSKWGAE